jgi:predicted transposase/invertase (TIGR01784 family)
MKRDDTLWKGILEDIFDDFLRFMYPNADEIFDMARGFDFLDKELEDLFPQTTEENIRYVDKLVKVWLKNGDEEWILIHIEVQGKQQKLFTERMFIYFYRIRDRYQRKITAWAILTDKNKKFTPTEFRESFLGTSNTYQFNLYKVINQDEKALMAMDNPFSIVVLTVLLALKKSNKQEVELIDLKMDLVRHLITKSISKQKIRALMNFLQHYVRFNNENTLIFEQKLEQFTGKTYPMGIEQLLLQRAEIKGEQRGEKKGEKKGEKIGEQRGDDRRKSEVIRKARLKGFSLEVIADITDLSVEQLKAILAKMGIE